MKLNDKGFAVSTILYALLISFLLFLLVTLKQVSASTNLMNAANDDLVNGGSLFARQVINSTGVNADGENIFSCGNWFNQGGKDTLVKIYSRYGIKFWPRDFRLKDTNGKIKVSVSESRHGKADDPSSFSDWHHPPYVTTSHDYSDLQPSGDYVFWLKIIDTVTTEVYYLPLYDICG